jgi:hypothetical protein
MESSSERVMELPEEMRSSLPRKGNSLVLSLCALCPEREKERERGREREGGREKERVCVCVCVRERESE